MKKNLLFQSVYLKMDFIDDFLNFIDIAAEVEENFHRIPRRYIRDVQNPLEFYRELEFKQRFRFSKDTTRNVLLPLVTEQLSKHSNRGLPISPMHQIFVALRFYATGSFQVIKNSYYVIW